MGECSAGLRAGVSRSTRSAATPRSSEHQLEGLLLKGILDRVDFNAPHGVRDLAADRLSNLIERISEKRLGLIVGELEELETEAEITRQQLHKILKPLT